MAESSAAEGMVKFGLGLGVGYGLCLLIQNLGLGGGFGGGRGEARGDGTSPALPGSSPPSIPRDEQRLEFLMVGPTTPNNKKATFRGPGGQIYSLEEMIARIKAGGRTDVLLRVRGDVISGPTDNAEAEIKQAGIDLWKPAPPPLFPEKQPAPVKTVAGNARGQYGRNCYRGDR